jgi:hypothetical protein
VRLDVTLEYVFMRFRERGSLDLGQGRRGLRLRIIPGIFAVCRLGPDDAVPSGIAAGGLLSITRTPEELSIICREEVVPEGARCEKGWKCLVVEGPLPFSATGILASLAGPLAEAGISIFAVSTFDTDYLLVPEPQIARAVAALEAAGHQVDGLNSEA